jgi:beta-glucosidase
MISTSELSHAVITGLQAGNSTAIITSGTYRLLAMCKHFAAFGSPYNSLNIAPVLGGKRKPRSTCLLPFKIACLEGDALVLMCTYNSYDGVPAVANDHLMVNIVCILLLQR